MSGESVGSAVIIPAAIIALPVLATGLVLKGCVSVVTAIIENERRIREEQRRKIAAEGKAFLSMAKQELETQMKEIEVRQKKRDEEVAIARKKAGEDVANKKEEERRRHAHETLSVSEMEGVKQNLLNELGLYEARISRIKEAKLQQTLRQKAENIKSSINNLSPGEVEILRNEISALGESASVIISCGYDMEEKKTAINEMISFIESRLEIIPPVYFKYAIKDINEIQDALDDFKKDPFDNVRANEDRLKDLKVRIVHVLKKADEKWKDEIRETEEIEAIVTELRISAGVVLDSSLIADKTEAKALQSELSQLYALSNRAEIRMRLGDLTSKVNVLYLSYLEAKRLEDERDYILNNVQETLTGMGYKVKSLPYKKREAENASKFVEFKVPGGEAVRIGLNKDKKFQAQIYHPADEKFDEENLRSQEAVLCSHLAQLTEGLKGKGIACEIKAEQKLSDDMIKFMKDMTGVSNSEEIDAVKPQVKRIRKTMGRGNA